MRASVLSFLAVGLLAGGASSGCAPAETAPVTDESDLTGTTYYDMDTRLSGATLASWHDHRAALLHSFDHVCGDTYCSGDYANLSTIALKCSITQSNYVKECNWVLGGTIEYVDGATGKYTVDARTFPCTVPVKADVNAFLDALDEEPEVVKAPLPVTGQSFYNGIGACLAGVVGKVPPASTGTTYEEIADYFNEHPDPGFWFGVRRHVNDAFASTCATSFCTETWKNITGLRFVCATNGATGNVQSCLWDFGVANTKVTSKGKVSATAKVLGCPIKATGSATALEAVLGGPTPLTAALPGSTKTLAQQLDDCL